MAEAAGISIQVDYFAMLREERGLGSETIATAATTPRQLYDELRARHGFRLSPKHMEVAINDEFGKWDAALKSGDRVVFIPPVAGG